MKSKEAGERLSWWHQGNNDALDEGKYSIQEGHPGEGGFSFLPTITCHSSSSYFPNLVKI